ncbi:MAG: VPLPA-CTERM sorting domain-containing protein [Pseudomonadota bacterium]
MLRRLLAAFASAAALAFVPSQAAILDLTDRSVFSGAPQSGAWINNIAGSGINVFIESQGGATNTNERGPTGWFCANDPMLACESDGVGIGDDEITARRNESITLTFSTGITLVEVYFLDLFKRHANSTDARDIETAVTELWTGNTAAGFTKIGTLFTDASLHNGGGFERETLTQLTRVDRLVFRAGSGRDDGSSDFALAGLNFASTQGRLTASTPVPGALPLFLAGAIGLGAARRRRKLL